MPSTSDAALTTICCDCGIERHFNKYDVRRGRHESLRCHVCAIKHHHKNKPKRTKEEKAKYRKEYYQKHKQKLDKYANDWREQKRLEAIESLGGCCVQCGENDPIVLDFDHINDDGAEHRRQTNKKNVVYLVAEESGRFQLLCKNCNWRKEYARRKQNAVKKHKAA